jgi:anaerobic selenocysteine-containing dehydrogenase
MAAPADGVHFRACNLCEAICGLAIRTEGGRITDVRGDPDDPFSRGHVCPKAVALQDVQDDPDRLRRPLRRVGSEWREVSWEEALDETARRLVEVRRAHGRDAVAVYLGNPNVHNSGSLLFGLPFLKALRTRNVYSATSVDQLPHHLAAWAMFGHRLLIPIPDVDRTSYLLILGANPRVSNGSLMTAPGIGRRLDAIRERGGTVVVVDPRRTETARKADRHLPIRPGTDALLLAATLHTLFEEGLAGAGRMGRLAAVTDGLDALAAGVAPFSPERVAPATGVPAAETRRLARELAGAEAAVVYGRLGVSVQELGGLCHWLINALNAVTGNLDRAGGAMFPRAAVDLVARSGPGGFDRYRSRVSGLPEFSRELPVAALAEEILTPGDGQVRALVTSAGNPVLSTPAGHRLDAALAGLDFMVSVDLYLNETTRHADLILPPTPPLEHDHYDLAFLQLAVRHVARYSPPLLEPPAGALHDWQIFLELQTRLALADPSVPVGRKLAARARRRAMAAVGPRGLLDLALRTGPYGAGFVPGRAGLTLRRLEREPHGVDFGPLAPGLPGRLHTPDRRIALAPDLFTADLARLERRLGELAQEAAGGALVLVGRRHVRSNNSWMHNAPRLMKGKERCTLLVHPHDAARLGIAEGAGEVRVAVTSRTGRVEVVAEVSDEMMPGVVSLPHGWGHDRPGIRLATASAHAGASANDLTDPARVDHLSGNAALSGVPVTVEVL